MTARQNAAKEAMVYLIDQGLINSDGSAKAPFTPSVQPDHLNRAQLTKKIIVFAESFGSGLDTPLRSTCQFQAVQISHQIQREKSLDRAVKLAY